MRDDEWVHLTALVDALVAGGNSVVGGGFRPTQGGTVCQMERPLDPAVVAQCAARDVRIEFDAEADEAFCRHCWTTVFGSVAVARYRSVYDASTQSTDREPLDP
jgi:hypothetical protein